MLETSEEKEYHMQASKFRKNLFGEEPYDEVIIADMYNQIYYEMRRHLIKVVESGYYKTIYFEAINFSRERRKSLYDLLKRMEKKVNVEAVFFSNPFSSMLEQHKKRGKDGFFPAKSFAEIYLHTQPPKLGYDCDRLVIMGRPILPYHMREEKIKTVEECIYELRDIYWARELKTGQAYFEKMNEIIKEAPNNHKKLLMFLVLSKGIVDKLCLEYDIEVSSRFYGNVGGQYFINYLGNTKNMVGLIDKVDLQSLEVITMYESVINGDCPTVKVGGDELIKSLEQARDFFKST